MNRLCVPLLFLVLVAGVFTIDAALAQVQSEFTSEPAPLPATTDIGPGENVDGQIRIQFTERISIPFGIAPVLSIHDVGEKVVVNGHGGCTAGEVVTVAISVTQATGPAAVGQTDQNCTGELQQWTVLATVNTETNLAPGNAEACGVATTRSDGKVTDTFAWCRDVVLGRPTYLPLSLSLP